MRGRAMTFDEKIIDSLRESVREILSEKRFVHTIGVEEMAVMLGELCLPDRIFELRAAALLHDISKEYSEAEYFEIAKRHNIVFSDEDLSSPALWHSITAPLAVLEKFPELASEDVLSAVRNHTTGSPGMTLFDEIILISDYIEYGRKYQNCIEVREELLSSLATCISHEERILCLHRATLSSLNNNINGFISSGKPYHSRTKATRDWLAEITKGKTMEEIKDLLNADSGTLAREAVKILLEKKAINVTLFDVREKSSVTDYYINATGRSSTQVASLADDVDAKLSERGRAALRTEGRRGNSWILVDFGDVIVNVFDRESREFYNLDRHFPEESKLDISDLVAEVDAKFDTNKN